jgi:hypothetical protein
MRAFPPKSLGLRRTDTLSATATDLNHVYPVSNNQQSQGANNINATNCVGAPSSHDVASLMMIGLLIDEVGVDLGIAIQMMHILHRLSKASTSLLLKNVTFRPHLGSKPPLIPPF